MTEPPEQEQPGTLPIEPLPRDDHFEQPAHEPERTDEDDPGPEEKQKRSRPFWVEVPLLMILALLIAVVIKTFLVQAFFIPSASMQDTLLIDDRILVNKLAFDFDEPHRGDVIVFDSGERREESFIEAVRRNLGEAVGLSAPESDFIKRVVGMPGRDARDSRESGVDRRCGPGRALPAAGDVHAGLRTGADRGGPLLHDGRQPQLIERQPLHAERSRKIGL